MVMESGDVGDGATMAAGEVWKGLLTCGNSRSAAPSNLE